MALPPRAEILGFMARVEAFEKTLEHFPGLTRDHLRALLREAALVMRAEEEGVEAVVQAETPRAPLTPSPPLRVEPSPPKAEPAVVPGTNERRMLRVFSDGAARGNPGPAGAGAVLMKEDGSVVAKCGKYLGVQTNNVAEYAALVLGLETALRLGANEVEVVADSELMIRQLSGAYRVKSPGLKPLFEQVTGLLARFRKHSARHVPRAQNTLADEMSNRAIDEKL